jgi:hypothetical protein
LGAVSLSDLAGTVCKFGLLLFATSALIGWAFLKPGKRNYRLWGIVACFVLGVVFLFVSNPTADGIASPIGGGTRESCATIWIKNFDAALLIPAVTARLESRTSRYLRRLCRHDKELT